MRLQIEQPFAVLPMRSFCNVVKANLLEMLAQAEEARDLALSFSTCPVAPPPPTRPSASPASPQDQNPLQDSSLWTSMMRTSSLEQLGLRPHPAPDSSNEC